DRQVDQTRSRTCFGTRYQWRRHIRRDGSICSPQPGTGQWLACSRKAVGWPPGPRPWPPTNSATGRSSVTLLVTVRIPFARCYRYQRYDGEMTFPAIPAARVVEGENSQLTA